MRKLLALVMLGLALSLFVSPVSRAVEPTSEVPKPLIKCSTCGVEFTSQVGIEDHLKTHPTHKAATIQAAKPLIKCDTCGVVFTSQAGLEAHLKAYPTHKAATPGETAKPLIKCSTCGVEFTSLKELQEHMKAHPEHKVVPIE